MSEQDTIQWSKEVYSNMADENIVYFLFFS